MLTSSEDENEPAAIPTVSSLSTTVRASSEHPTTHLLTYDTSSSTSIMSVQESNAPMPISVTLCGISSSLIDVQPQKAACPIEVTLSEMITLLRALQSTNASSQIRVTPFGIVILSSELHPLNKDRLISAAPHPRLTLPRV